jgi:hypothetical protein
MRIIDGGHDPGKAVEVGRLITALGSESVYKDQGEVRRITAEAIQAGDSANLIAGMTSALAATIVAVAGLKDEDYDQTLPGWCSAMRRGLEDAAGGEG